MAFWNENDIAKTDNASQNANQASFYQESDGF